MNFVIESNILLNQLKIIKNVIKNNQTIPILNNILIHIQNNKLKIIGSDLEVSIIITNKIEKEKEKELIVPINTIINILKTFNNNKILNLIFKKNIIKIKSQNGKYLISSIYNKNEYPKIENDKKYNNIITIKKTIIKKALNYTLFTVNNDEMKPIMNGVFFKIKNNKITFVATNAQRLSKYSYKINNNYDINFIIPKKPLLILKKILSSSEEKDVKIQYNKQNTMFIIDNKKIACRLIEGKYPDYNSVIPQNNDQNIIVNRLKFLNCIQRISIFSEKKKNQIKLYIENNEIKITAKDVLFMHKANEKFKCIYTGKFIKIIFNSKSLIEILTHLNSQKITLKINNKKSPVIFTEISNKKNIQEKITMLLMPLL